MEPEAKKTENNEAIYPVYASEKCFCKKIKEMKTVVSDMIAPLIKLAARENKVMSFNSRGFEGTLVSSATPCFSGSDELIVPY